MMRLLLHWLFWYLILGIVASGTASAEECSGTITAEEALRAEDARYAAQLANDFAAMERMFGSDLVYIRSIDGAAADKRALHDAIDGFPHDPRQQPAVHEAQRPRADPLL